MKTAKSVTPDYRYYNGISPCCDEKLVATATYRDECPACGNRYIMCHDCGWANDVGDKYTMCSDCNHLNCNYCGGDVEPETYYTDNDGREYIDKPAHCEKCGEL